MNLTKTLKDPWYGKNKNEEYPIIFLQLFKHFHFEYIKLEKKLIVI